MANFSLYDDCIMLPLNADVKSRCLPFSCGNADLDEFFEKDADLYSAEMLGKTYCWITQEKPYQIVCAFTLSNDSIRAHSLKSNAINRYQRNINNAKRGHRSYPAALIGRLGVNKNFHGKQFMVGSQLMTFIKNWFRDTDNKTGCRFLIVDAYNEPSVLDYYINRNGFKFLHTVEEEEKSFYGIPQNEILKTRMLFFDLKVK